MSADVIAHQGNLNISLNGNGTCEESFEQILDSPEFKSQLRDFVTQHITQDSNLDSSATEQLKKLLLNSSPAGGDFLDQKLSSPNSSIIACPHPNVVLPINDLRDSNKNESSQLRCKLASLYRLIDMHGWSHGVYNHISCRADKNTFYINSFGLLFHEISASNLVKVSLQGEIVDRGSSPFGINKAGWSLHSIIHQSRPDVFCVLHLHLADVIAVSSMKCGLLPVSAEAQYLLSESSGGVKYHSYYGIITTNEEIASIKSDLGDTCMILLLRNHGAAICGKSIEQVWRLTRLLVTACQTQARMALLGGLESFKNVKVNHDYSCTAEEFENLSKMEWEAMMRVLDNAGLRTGYKYTNPQLMERILGSLTSAAEIPMHYEFNENFARANSERIREAVSANKKRAFQRSKYLSSKSEERSEYSENRDKIIAKMNVAQQNQQPQQKHENLSTNTTTITNTSTSPNSTIKTTTITTTTVCHDSEKAVDPTINKSATFSYSQVAMPTEIKNSHTLRSSDVSENNLKHSTIGSGQGSPDENQQNKKGLKIGGIRIPSFSKKKDKLNQSRN